VADYLQLNLALEDSQSGELVALANGTADVPSCAEALPIGGQSAVNLRLWPRKENHKVGDKSLLLRSLVGLLAVELERKRLERDAQRREGAALLQRLLEEDTPLSLARPLLEQRGLFGDLQMLAIAAPKHQAFADWPPQLAGQPWLMFEQSGLLIALAVAVDKCLPLLQAQLAVGGTIGISSLLSAGNGFAQALCQAQLALAQAKESLTAVQRYGETAAGLLPHSLSEARLLVQRSLCALIDYDRQHGSALLNTLMQFLDNNSQYKATCLELGIHRQTLVYRLKLIEQLSGLKPSTSEGLSRLWLAVKAGRAAGLL